MLAGPHNSFLQQTTQPLRYPTAYPASTPSPSDRTDGRYKQQRQDFSWDGSQQSQQHVLAFPPSQDNYNMQHNYMQQPSTPQIRLSQHPQMPHTPPTSIASSSPSRRPAGAFPDNSGRWPNKQQMTQMLRNPASLQHQRGPSNSSNESRMSASSFSQPAGMMNATGGYPTPGYDTTTFGMVSGPDSAAAVAAFNPYSRELAVPSQDDMPQLSPSHVQMHKGRPSVSSDFQGPLTPRTHVTDDLDHALDASNFDYKPHPSKMGASTLETLDEMYRSAPYQQQQQHSHQHSNSMNRQFRRPGQHNGMPSPNPALDNYLRAANSEHQSQHAVFGGNSPFDNVDAATPKTISPKDTLLEATEQDEDQANMLPLFPMSSQSSQRSNELGFNMDSRRTSSAFSLGSAYNTIPAPAQLLSQYPFVPRHERTQPEPPEFKVSLLRMGTQGSDYSDPSRPANTRAETGTYTCTYHGCTLRFETPQKLQKHKREGHRQNHSHSNDLTPGGGVRDSQAGPHTCRRINPSTGKPCNTQFSRPYDLTRHEDTIHNGRKQKVRCELCTEEKTFSRNDALTRHMRVVHPEVDFPGKSRRKVAAH